MLGVILLLVTDNFGKPRLEKLWFMMFIYIPRGWRGKAPVGCLGEPDAEAVCRHCLQILPAETRKIWKFHTIHLLILDRYVSRWGLSDILGLSALAYVSRRHCVGFNFLSWQVLREDEIIANAVKSLAIFRWLRWRVLP